MHQKVAHHHCVTEHKAVFAPAAILESGAEITYPPPIAKKRSFGRVLYNAVAGERETERPGRTERASSRCEVSRS